MKPWHAVAAFAFLVPGFVLGQDQSSAAWHFARASWGCSLNLAIRNQPDTTNSLSNVELSYMIASTNPSTTFRIPENELTFSVNVRGYDQGEATSLEISINGTQIQLEDLQFANHLSVFTASTEQASNMLESMESGAQIVIQLRLSTGAELKRVLHDGGFASESKHFKECL